MGVLNYTHYTALRLILSSLLDTTSLNPDDAMLIGLRFYNADGKLIYESAYKNGLT